MAVAMRVNPSATVQGGGNIAVTYNSAGGDFVMAAVNEVGASTVGGTLSDNIINGPDTGSWTKIATQPYTGGVLTFWVRDKTVSQAFAGTVTYVPSASQTAGACAVGAFTGMPVGASFSIQSATSSGAAGSGANSVTVTMGAAMKTYDVLFTAEANLQSDSGLGTPTGFSNVATQGSSTGVTHTVQTNYRATGQTGTTLTYPNNPATAWAMIAVEFPIANLGTDMGRPTITADTSQVGAWKYNYNAGTRNPQFRSPPMFSLDVKQNTAIEVRAYFRDKITLLGKTGLVLSQIAASVQKTGAAFTSVTPTSFTERGNGWYSIGFPASASDTLGLTPLHIAANDITGALGALPNDEIVLNVVAYDPQDAVRLGLSALPNAAAGALGGLATPAVRSATAQGPGTGSNQIQLDAGASAVDSFYNRQLIILTGGVGAGQARFIAHYVGATKTASVNRNWVTNPDATTTFQVMALSNSLLTEGLAQGGTTTSITLKASEPSTTDFYKGVWIHISSGTGAGQARLCTSFNGTTKVAGVDTAWAVTPDTTSVYQVLTGADVTVGSSVVTTDVNVVKINGDTVAPPNLANAFNGTGYTAPTGPAQQQQVAHIAVTGAALNTIAATRTVTTGVPSGGVNNTFATDNVYDTIGDSAGVIDFFYEFQIGSIGGAVGVGIEWVGYVVGNNDDLKVFAFNWNTSAWDQLDIVPGSNQTTNRIEEWTLTNSHTGTGGNLGLVRIRFQGTGLVAASCNTDRILMGYTIMPATATDVSNAQAAILAAIPSAATIRDAILDAARSGHITVGSIGEAIALSASLLQGNFYIDNVTNTDNGPTAQRLRCWLSAAAMAGVTPGGSGQGEFATFIVTTTYSGPGKIVTHQVTQQ